MIHPPQLSQITSVTSVLPGTLVQGLVTAVLTAGLNVQLLGYFHGTVDLFHLPPGEIASLYKPGQKVREMKTIDVSRCPQALLTHISD